MNRQPVESSSIASVGYDSSVLEIEFRHGAVYRYRGVPKPLFEAFMASESMGRFFLEEIRDAFAFVRVS
jgi:hypothetical protein